MLASTGYDGELSLPARLWCGLPLMSGYVSALSIANAWLGHTETRDDEPLHDLLDQVITAVWPTKRSIAPPSAQTLHLALNLQRYVNRFYGAGPLKHEVGQGSIRCSRSARSPPARTGRSR